MSHFRAKVLVDGFEIVANVLEEGGRAALLTQLGPLADAGAAPGTRGLLEKCPAIGALAASSAIRALVEPILGQQARLVRSIFFNKTPQRNWQVGWHQDLTIAVQARFELPGYGPWSIKDGIAHVQPPVDILENMLTVRVHLDDTDATNGALWVMPGSHRLGRLSAQDAVAIAKSAAPALCALGAGAAMAFRPLLVHSSRKSSSDRQRRVVHLEFCSARLPAPLAWASVPAARPANNTGCPYTAGSLFKR